MGTVWKELVFLNNDGDGDDDDDDDVGGDDFADNK